MLQALPAPPCWAQHRTPWPPPSFGLLRKLSSCRKVPHAAAGSPGVHAATRPAPTTGPRSAAMSGAALTRIAAPPARQGGSQRALLHRVLPRPRGAQRGFRRRPHRPMGSAGHPRGAGKGHVWGSGPRRRTSGGGAPPPPAANGRAAPRRSGHRHLLIGHAPRAPSDWSRPPLRARCRPMGAADGRAAGGEGLEVVDPR